MARLHGRSLRERKRRQEEVNPMDGVSNLADVMLVLACGLMLALIINWNVDVGPAENMVGIDQGMEVTESVNDGGDNADSQDQEPGEYEEVGSVYRDPKTGKLYMVTEDKTRQ